jgi:ferrous iron transport protein A
VPAQRAAIEVGFSLTPISPRGRHDSSRSFTLWRFADDIDNQSHLAFLGWTSLRLDQLPFRTLATVTGIDWSLLTSNEARRLRNLGLDEGVSVEALHGGPVGRDPLAVKIGRMMVAIRRSHAHSISVEPVAFELAAE